MLVRSVSMVLLCWAASLFRNSCSLLISARSCVSTLASSALTRSSTSALAASTALSISSWNFPPSSTAIDFSACTKRSLRESASTLKMASSLLPLAALNRPSASVTSGTLAAHAHLAQACVNCSQSPSPANLLIFASVGGPSFSHPAHLASASIRRADAPTHRAAHSCRSLWVCLPLASPPPSVLRRFAGCTSSAERPMTSRTRSGLWVSNMRTKQAFTNSLNTDPFCA
mmetsp:Transcript_123511/g.349767  ORF Transcript_123511/g.349767 Transcript_123511/m.349767 type:complete len:229 (+) Transcript_123511:261-947(+)